MSIIHKVTGYDKQTDLLAREFDIPDDRLDELRELAHVPDEQKVTYGSFPLDRVAARNVSGRFNLPMNVDQYEWFFEPFAQD